MRRREFIAVLGGMVAASPFAARAQQPVPAVGLLSMRSPDDAATARQMAAFRQGLKEVGFQEGVDVAIEYRWAAGHYDQLPAFAADLVQRKVAVIVAHAGTDAVLAAKAPTSTIPIVFVSGIDPVKLGVVASLNNPGANITSISITSQEIIPKQLELLTQIIPNATAIGVLQNPAYGGSAFQLHEVEEAARSLGGEIVVANASTEADFGTAFASLIHQRAGGTVISGDPFFNTHIEQLALWTARYKIPAITTAREFPAAGGLMSYGASFNDANRIAGNYVGRILKGTKAADLPVQRSTTVELIINLKTAKALGLTIPLPVLGRADEVIE
jgi:putative tryptophan/tyrosine transport system substrate-binding protein